MKLTIHSAALVAGAGLAGKTVSTNPTAAVLGGVALAADADGLTLTATGGDHDSWIRTQYPGDVQTAGGMVVSARLLAAVAAGMPVGQVDLVREGSTLVVTGAKRARATLPTMPIEDYPAWPQVPDGAHGTVAGPALAAGLDVCARIATAPSTSGVGPLHRVTLVTGSAGLRMLATDRYRLLCLDLPWAGTAPPVETSIGLDPGAVGPLILMAKASEQVTLSFPAAEGAVNVLEAGVGRARALSRLVGGEPPNIGQFLTRPADYRSMTIATADLLRLVALVEPFVAIDAKDRKIRGPAIIRLDGDQWRMTAGTDDNGAVDQAIEVQGWDGEDWATGVNPGFLADIAKALGGQRIRVWVGRPHQPLYLTRDTDGELSARAVLMPVRIPATGRTDR